jgi:hypothetical protein
MHRDRQVTLRQLSHLAVGAQRLQRGPRKRGATADHRREGHHQRWRWSYGGVRSAHGANGPRHHGGMPMVKPMATDYEKPRPPKPTQQQSPDAPTARCKQVDQVHREHGDSPMHPR